LFSRLGEERFSGRLAKRIVEERAMRPIETTSSLAALAEAAVPFRGRIHPATRIFQALRMEVNDEQGALSRGLAAGGRLLAPGGRLAVITFHSLEDRLVKRTFLRWRDLGAVRLVNAHAVSCGRGEAAANRRARSARLRVVERIEKGMS
jgi:16S rRNA (cytosine1402-N4)-methyltransferase